MDRERLRDDQQERIDDLVPGMASDGDFTARDNRRFVGAISWVMRDAPCLTDKTA